MGEAQLAFSNFLFFVVVSILIIYIIYNLIKRFVEKSEEDLTRVEERSKGSMFREFIFTFLYSGLAACFIYIINHDITGAILFFVVTFILGLLKSERTREPKSSKSKTGKIFSYIVYLALLCLLIFITVTSTASMISKVGAWFILFLTYFIEKIEKKYFISGHTSSHDGDM